MKLLSILVGILLLIATPVFAKNYTELESVGTSQATDDLLPMWDTSTGETKTVTIGNLFSYLYSIISPATDDTYDIGSPTKKWKDLYIDGIGYFDGLDMPTVTDGNFPYMQSAAAGFGDSPLWTDGTDTGVGTATPAGKFHTVLSAGHPAIFGGGTIGVFTACTFLTATKTQISKTGIGTGMDEGDLVIVTGGTGATVGEYRAVTIDSADLITVDRDIHAEGSNITDGAVKTAKNVVVINVSDGTNGQRIMNYSHQDKPLQIGGDELVATGHSLGSEDVLIGGKLEVDGPVYFDGDNVFYAGNTFTAGLKIPGVAYLRLGDGVVGNGTLHPNTSTDQLEFLIDDGLGRQIVIGDYEWRSLDFDHATTTNPTVFIHSVISPNTSNNQWGSFTHDQEDFVITTGVETGAGDGATTIPNAISFAPQGTVAQRMLVANGIAYNLFGVTEIDSQTDEDSTSDTNLTSSATASYQVGDAVLIWGGTTTADYGLYYITAIPGGTDITINTALSSTVADVDYYVLRGGMISTGGNLDLKGDLKAISLAADATSVPGISGIDADGEQGKVAMKIYGNLTTVTANIQVGDITTQVMGAQGTAGTLENAYVFDGSIRALIVYGSVVPGQETITCAADACVENIKLQTHFIISEGGAEVDADTLTLDNGTIIGQEVTFIFKTESDVGDTIVIDTAQQVGWGSFTMDVIGDSVTFIWDGTNWTIKSYYLGTVG